MTKAVVLGAGITGLSAANRLAEAGVQVTVFEQGERIGGLSSSFRHKDMLLDYGPHKLYSQLPAMDDLKKLMQGRLLEQEKKSKVWLCGKYFNFPLSMVDIGLGLNPFTTLRLGISYGVTLLKGKKDGSYPDYVISRFGRKTYELVFGPYAEKVWGNPGVLSSDMAVSRVAAPSLMELLKRTLIGDKGKPELSAKTFFYPRKGLQDLSDAYAESIESHGGKIITAAPVVGLEMQKNRIASIKVARKGRTSVEKTDIVVSTIPLGPLLNMLPTNDTARTAASQLQYKDLVLLYLVINKNRLFEESFLFYPEKSVVFNRISEQKAFSPEMIPSGKTVLCVELTHPDYVEASDDEIFNRALVDLEKTKITHKGEVAEWFIIRIPKAYQIYDIDYKRKLDVIFSSLDPIDNLYSIGRNGAFSYTGIVDCIDMGNRTALFITGNRPRTEWAEVRKTFYNYKVID